MKNINGYIVFFTQVTICYIIILTCLACIVSGTALSKEYSNLFVSLTSSAIGYILPNPVIKTPPPPSPNDDSPDGASTSSNNWHLFGRVVPKSEMVFISQVVICYIIILVSIGCLAVGQPSSNDYLFTILTSSTLGYLLPCPKLQKTKDVVHNNPT